MSKRDPKRLTQIRLLGCCCGCGRPAPSDVAHSNASIHGKGFGIKSKDEFTIPLNRVCHSKFDGYKMGMNRQESLEWFERKRKFIDEVLNDINESKTPIL